MSIKWTDTVNTNPLSLLFVECCFNRTVYMSRLNIFSYFIYYVRQITIIFLHKFRDGDMFVVLTIGEEHVPLWMRSHWLPTCKRLMISLLCYWIFKTATYITMYLGLRNIYFRLFSNSEAFASELQDNLKEMFLCYW